MDLKSNDVIKYCDNCNKTGENVKNFINMSKDEMDSYTQSLIIYRKGYIKCNENETNCRYCGGKLETTNITQDDFATIAKASNYNRQLLEAMIELKKKDIIEYELKMGQFRTQVQQQRIAKEQGMKDKNIPKCPTCNSTNLSKISNVKKATKIGLFGIFGAGDIGKTWKCNNCGSKF